MFLCDSVLRSDSNEAQKNQIKLSIDNFQNGGWFFRHFHLALFSLRTESDNPDATCELSP